MKLDEGWKLSGQIKQVGKGPGPVNIVLQQLGSFYYRKKCFGEPFENISVM